MTIKNKILLVDDEPDILVLLEHALQIEGYTNIVKETDGIAAVALCKKENPAAIVLDIMLPSIDGFEVCRRVREFSHAPILFLSAKSDEIDKLLGLAVGGDDYVTKPFSPKEVAYRVKAQLRRSEYMEKTPENIPIQIGDILIEKENCRVLKCNQELPLTAREFSILLHLAENRNRVISRERLYEAVWGEDSFGCDNTVMVHIRHLREKIEDDPNSPQYLITVKGLGYKLVDAHEK